MTDLADLMPTSDGPSKRRRGRPKRGHAYKAVRSIHRSAQNPIWRAMKYAERYRRVWKKRYGFKYLLTLPDGSRVSLVKYACLKGCERVRADSLGKRTVDQDSVLELLNRSKKRRLLF